MTPTAAALTRKSTKRGVKEGGEEEGGLWEMVARMVVSDAVSTAEEGARRARRPDVSVSGRAGSVEARPRRLGNVAETPVAAAASTRPHMAVGGVQQGGGRWEGDGRGSAAEMRLARKKMWRKKAGVVVLRS